MAARQEEAGLLHPGLDLGLLGGDHPPGLLTAKPKLSSSDTVCGWVYKVMVQPLSCCFSDSIMARPTCRP